MAYRNIAELPDPVQKHLPAHAQEIYLRAFNNAWEEYSDPKKRRGSATLEETARRVAWAAVKEVYEKDEKSGEWKKKRAKGAVRAE